MKNWHTGVYSQENQISSYHHHFRHEPSMPVSISITSYPPLMQIAINNQILVISAEININPPVENQPSFEEPIQTNDSPTDSIDQDTNDQQVYNEPVPIQPELLQAREESAEAQSTTSKKDTSHAIEGHLRRSSRVAKLSAKALQLATENGNKP